MTYSASTQSSTDPWNYLIELFSPDQPPAPTLPQPMQDADLLRQLNFIPGLKEILMLRQVHALEHATVWILGEFAQRRHLRSTTASPSDNEALGGMSTDRGFYLYGQVNSDELGRAVQIALQRITSGDWNLAIHPRCGTNLSVNMLLTAGLTLGMFVVLPRGPIEQLLGFGVAAAMANQLAPDLGGLAQRYITTAIPFNLAIERISPRPDHLGRPAHFIQVRWIE